MNQKADPRHILGLQNEYRVLHQCLKSNFEIIKIRSQIKGVECDLLIKTPKNEIWWIEVKSIFSGSIYPQGISNYQIRRIRQSLNWLMCDLSPQVIRGHLVTVGNNQVTWHFDYFANNNL